MNGIPNAIEVIIRSMCCLYLGFEVLIKNYLTVDLNPRSPVDILFILIPASHDANIMVFGIARNRL